MRADEVERVLRMFSDRVSDEFVLHCYTKDTPRGPLFAPVLELETKSRVDFEILARDIAAQLRTGPSFTYAQGIDEGRYLPLECRAMEDAGAAHKHRRIVEHS